MKAKERTRTASLMIGRTEFAQLCGISAKTLDTHRATGRIGPQPVRLGGSLRWNRLEVEEWLKRRTARNELPDARAWAAIWRGGRT